VELWLFRWLLGLQGAQSSRGVSLFTPLAPVAVAAGAGDAVGLSPSSPPNTGHSIHAPFAPNTAPFVYTLFALSALFLDAPFLAKLARNFSNFFFSSSFPRALFFSFFKGVTTRARAVASSAAGELNLPPTSRHHASMSMMTTTFARDSLQMQERIIVSCRNASPMLDNCR
jgi:hypothetical protein